MSSLSGSLSASATGCSSPNGPQRLGPGRFCMRPMIRRSAQIIRIWNSSRNRKITSTLMAMIHQTSGVKLASVGSAADTAPAARLLIQDSSA